MADVFLVQDEIVSQIVAKIAGPYGVIEEPRPKPPRARVPNKSKPMTSFARARHHAVGLDRRNLPRRERNIEPRHCLDPSNARARRDQAWLAVLGWVFQLDETPVAKEEIVAQATKAAQLDPADARARMVAASAYFFTKQLDLFEHEAEQAFALAPYDAEIIATLACMISSAGDHARGVELAKKANALNADSATGWYHTTVYTADYLNGDYQRAIEVARAESRPRDVLLVYRDHPDLWPAWPQEGGARGVAHAARRNSRRIRQDLRGLVAFVEYLRARDYPADGRRL